MVTNEADIAAFSSYTVEEPTTEATPEPTPTP